jgi:hypothetical protein
LKTLADLDGLGASESALITWTISAGLGRTFETAPVRPAYETPARPMNLPTAARTGSYDRTWLAFAIVLCLALLLVTLLKTNDKSKDKR